MSVESVRAPEPVGPYPHARWPRFCTCRESVPVNVEPVSSTGVELDKAGRIVAADIRAQCKSCFANVKAVVEDAGAEWSDVFDVLAF